MIGWGKALITIGLLSFFGWVVSGNLNYPGILPVAIGGLLFTTIPGILLYQMGMKKQKDFQKKIEKEYILKKQRDIEDSKYLPILISQVEQGDIKALKLLVDRIHLRLFENNYSYVFKLVELFLSDYATPEQKRIIWTLADIIVYHYTTIETRTTYEYADGYQGEVTEYEVEVDHYQTFYDLIRDNPRFNHFSK